MASSPMSSSAGDGAAVDLVSSVLVVSHTGSAHSIESLAVCQSYEREGGNRLLAGCTDGSLLVFQQKMRTREKSILRQLSEAANHVDINNNSNENESVQDRTSTDEHGLEESVAHLESCSQDVDDNDSHVMELIETHTSFAKKPVLQLTAETMNSSHGSNTSSTSNSSELLISLTDALNVHMLPHLRFHSSLSKTRGAGAYCWRRDDKRLIVSCRKKLILYRWDGFGFQEIRELNLSEVPKTIQWAANDAVCVAYKREYCLISTKNGESKVVCPTGKHGEPSITALPTGELLLLKDSVGIFVDGEGGQPTREHGIAWSAAPDDVVLIAWPHAIAIMPKMVEVKALHQRDDQSSGCIMFNQTLPLSGCIAVSERQSYIFDKSCSSRTTMDCGLYVSCANGTQIHRIDVIPITEQIKNLLEQGELEDAIELASLPPYNNEEDEHCNQELMDLKASLHLQVADSMMRAHDYERVLSNMQLAKVDLKEVISKYCVFMPSLVRETLCKVDPGLISSHDYTRHENVDYERAMSAFLTFLQTSSMTADEMDGRLIDTMILITLIFLKDKRLQSFLCGKHRVDNQLCIDALSSTGLHEELILFLKASNKHKQSLSLMRCLIDGKEVSLASEPSEDDDSVVVDLQYFAKYIKSLSEREILDNVSADDWIFVLRNDEAVSRQILPLMKLTMSVEDSMDMLRSHAPALCLEFMEDVDAASDGEVNTELLQLYIKAALREKERFVRSGRSGLEWEQENSDIRNRLINMLKRSKVYNVEETLAYFPDDGFFSEKSIIFMRQKYHKRALLMLIEDLNHYGKAVSYADEVWDDWVGGTWLEHIGDTNLQEEGNSYEDEIDERDIYGFLLEILRNNFTKQEVHVLDTKEWMINLLNERFERIDPTIAFSLIDSSIKLDRIRPFLNGIVLMSSELQKNSSMTKGLCRFQNLNTRNNYMTLCKTRVVVSSEMSCFHCKRRLGNSAFTVSVDGSLMHFGCSRDSGKTRDFKMDPESREFDSALLPNEMPQWKTTTL